jgi:hypothetical protein
LYHHFRKNIADSLDWGFAANSRFPAQHTADKLTPREARVRNDLLSKVALIANALASLLERQSAY